MWLPTKGVPAQDVTLDPPRHVIEHNFKKRIAEYKPNVVEVLTMLSLIVAEMCNQRLVIRSNEKNRSVNKLFEIFNRFA